MNKVFLIGNLTRDPELTETNSGISVCRFSIAVRRDYKNADGEYDTDYFNCQAWRGTAEAIARYAHKGNKLAVTGSLQNRTYEDRNGDNKTVTEIQAQDVEFLTPRQAGSYDGNAGQDVPRGQTRREQDSSRQMSAFDSPRAGGTSSLQAFDDDSDIPF